MKLLLGLESRDLYAEDHGLIDAMAARHPTWDRAHVVVQLFGAKAAALSLATWIASGCDSRGGSRPQGGVAGVKPTRL